MDVGLPVLARVRQARRVRLPAIVDDIVGAYLAMVDAEVAGLVEGLYLVGSVALGDFRPASSDIDFVAVTASHPSPEALAGLRRIPRPAPRAVAAAVLRRRLPDLGRPGR
jgi:predicted nucleotidyltransferase